MNNPLNKKEKARREKVTREYQNKSLKFFVDNIFEPKPWDEAMADLIEDEKRAIGWNH